MSTLDSAGVTLAAIQGLYEKAQEKDEQIAQLAKQLAVLETALTTEK